MCYSAKASLGSFLISFIGSYYLFTRNQLNDKKFAVIIFGVSLMQLSDFLIHKDIECNNNLNKIGSRLGFLSHIIIQPLFSLLATILFNNNKKINNKHIFGWIIIWIYYLYDTTKKWPKDKDWCSFKNKCKKGQKDCQLIWPWHNSINSILYGILVFILPILIGDIKNKKLWILYSIIMPEIIRKNYPKTIPSMWCFIGPVLTLLIKIYNVI